MVALLRVIDLYKAYILPKRGWAHWTGVVFGRPTKLKSGRRSHSGP